MVKVRIGIGRVSHILDINVVVSALTGLFLGSYAYTCIQCSSSLQGIAELPVCAPTSRVFAQLTLGADS